MNRLLRWLRSLWAVPQPPPRTRRVLVLGRVTVERCDRCGYLLPPAHRCEGRRFPAPPIDPTTPPESRPC